MPGKLQVAWTFSVGSDHGQEAAPIVVGDTMYVVGAYPNELFALDAATGEIKWKYSPRVDPSSQGVACCDLVNRGEVYDNGKIFFNTLGRSHRRGRRQDRQGSLGRSSWARSPRARP